VTRPAIKITLQYGLGFGLLAWVIYRNWHIIDEETGQEIGLAAALQQPVNWQAFTIGALLFSAAALLTFVRWFVLVRAQGLPFTFASALRLGLVGLYFSAFLPGSVGGDIVKAFAIAREQHRRTVAVATVILDRVIGLCALFWLVTMLGTILGATGVLRYLVPERSLPVLQSILLICAGLSLGSLAFWLAMGFFSESWSERMAGRLEGIPKIGHSIGELWRAVWLYRRRSASVGLALGMSLVGHFGFVLSFFFAAYTLMPEEKIPPLESHLVIVPVGMTIQAGVPTPGGVGGAEYGFGFLYRLVGYDFAAGALASLSYRVINWTLGLLGYLVYLRMRGSLPAPTATEVNEAATARPAEEL
jgi:uncharacterized membrane protein YbhN (UPF0104 family)